jgi:hypothetical protein
LKIDTIIAKPIADSAAAIAKINKTKIWPSMLSLKCEKTKKLVFMESNKSSIAINKIRIFFLLIIIPAILMQNSKALNIKYSSKEIILNP